MNIQSRELIKVGLVQIGDKYGDEYYFPYAIGLLQAYAQKNIRSHKEYFFMLPIYKKIKIDKAIEYLSEADIVFFSIYIWNYKISLEIAKGIKLNKGNCVIVFGGPQVPESDEAMETFLKNHPFIDLACYGEGEVPFLSILENFKTRSWKKVPAIGFLAKDDSFVYNLGDARSKDINRIASPYLEGIFEPLMEANPQDKWSALIETNRGCPYTCAFCYWGKKTRSKVHLHNLEKVFKEIDWFSQKKIEFVFCCDANFGLFERDVDIIKKVAENKRRYAYPVSFSVQNTKNSSKKIFAMQEILNDAGLQKGVNLAFQSLHEDTLKSINRSNISNEVYKDLQLMFTQSKIPTFSDMIIGLPNESYSSFTSGIANLIKNGQHNRIQFINLSVLENTVMSEPEYQKKYGFIISEVKAIPHHTSIEDESEVYETQRLVVGNNTMSREDWVKTKVFCWMTDLLYFNKVFQIPLLILHSIYLFDFKELIEIFTESQTTSPIISEIRSFFTSKAIEIQNGGVEYCTAKEWLNIWWPIDELVLIRLCAEDKLGRFYQEAKQEIEYFLQRKNFYIPARLLDESIYLNQNLVKSPFQYTDLYIELTYNIFEVYEASLRGTSIPIENKVFNYVIDRKSKTYSSWEDWCRKVVWYEKKKGAYFYSCRPLSGIELKQSKY